MLASSPGPHLASHQPPRRIAKAPEAKRVIPSLSVPCSRENQFHTIRRLRYRFGIPHTLSLWKNNRNRHATTTWQSFDHKPRLPQCCSPRRPMATRLTPPPPASTTGVPRCAACAAISTRPLLRTDRWWSISACSIATASDSPIGTAGSTGYAGSVGTGSLGMSGTKGLAGPATGTAGPVRAIVLAPTYVDLAVAQFRSRNG